MEKDGKSLLFNSCSSLLRWWRDRDNYNANSAAIDCQKSVTRFVNKRIIVIVRWRFGAVYTLRSGIAPLRRRLFFRRRNGPSCFIPYLFILRQSEYLSWRISRFTLFSRAVNSFNWTVFLLTSLKQRNELHPVRSWYSKLQPRVAGRSGAAWRRTCNAVASGRTWRSSARCVGVHLYLIWPHKRKMPHTTAGKP